MKGQALLAAILTALFGWLKYNHEIGKLNKKRKQLISEEGAKAAVESFLFEKKYFGNEKKIHDILREKIQGQIDHQKSSEGKEFGSSDNNLWVYALFLRQAIMLKYMMKKGIHKDLEEQLANISDPENSYESEMSTLKLEAMANESNIISFFKGQLTPELKKIFDSLDLRIYAYEEEEYMEYGELQEQIVEDMFEAYTLWEDRNWALLEEREAQLSEKGFSVTQAVDKLKLDENFNPVMKKLIDELLARNPSDASTNKLYEDGEKAVFEYFKKQEIEYQQSELEQIWDGVWLDENYKHSFLDGSSIVGDDSFDDNEMSSSLKVKSHAIKIYSENSEDNEIDFAIKVVVENTSHQDSAFVDVQGVDEEGFEVLGFVVSGDVKANGETTLSDRFDFYSLDEFKAVAEWKFSV